MHGSNNKSSIISAAGMKKIVFFFWLSGEVRQPLALFDFYATFVDSETPSLPL